MSQPLPRVPALTPEAEPSKAALDDSPRTLTWPQVWLLLLSFAAIATTLAQLGRHGPGAGLYLSALCLVVCLLAAWYDAATTRIPNPLTYTAILAGLLLHSAAPLLESLDLHAATVWLGTTGPRDAFLGFAFCTAIALACRLGAGMAGGDMKLLAAVGALIGYHDVRMLLLAALLVALPYALLNLALLGRLNAAARLVSLQILSLIYLKQRAPVEEVSKTHVPLAVPLLLGLLISRTAPMDWLWSGL